MGASALSDRFGDIFLAQVGPRTRANGFFASINAAFARSAGGTFRDSPYTYDLAYLREGVFFTGFTKAVRAATSPPSGPGTRPRRPAWRG